MEGGELTLVILAAGIGSRYGGLKQIEPVGPGGEIVIEYAVYDALRAGFRRVLCVIRRDIERDFRAVIGRRFEKQVAVDYVFQELDDLPAGFAAPPDRKKPWGTAHAVRACRERVQGPFAVINADDFYGRTAYQGMAEFLGGVRADNEYAMVGYVLRNTLSEHGSVARGICEVDGAGYLRGVVEHTRIEKTPAGIRSQLPDGRWQDLSGAEVASMNFWGFQPSIFSHLERTFEAFLRASGRDAKAEFFVPSVVDGLIRTGQATVRVLATAELWYGVTYPQDKPLVTAGIRRLVEQGLYPERLWVT